MSRYPFAIVLISTLFLMAFVNPNFTPIHVVNDAQTISHHRAHIDAGDPNRLILSHGVQLKGQGASDVVIHLSGIDPDERADEIDPLFASGTPTDAMVFLSAEGTGSAMHLGRFWATLQQADDGSYRVDEWNDGRFLGAWDGGTDQLLRVVRYVLDNADPQVPAVSGAEWSGHAQVGQVEGQVSAMQVLHRSDDDGAQLFVASDAGDQLLAWDGESAAFSPRGPALPTASTLSQWGAFAGDQQLSLVSYGESLQHVWSADGAWQQEALAIDGLASVSGLALAPGGQLLIAGGHGVAVAKRSDDQWSGSILGAALPEALQAGPLVLGDFNANGQLDILLLHSQGALLFAGLDDGSWAPGQALENAPALGVIRRAQAVDVDNDGLLDILAIGERGLSLWHNRGDGRFRERRADAGEIRYIPNALVRDLIVCDFNNDGRPDLVLLNPGMGPHIFYNRGFMVYGFAEDLVGGTLPQEIYQGQQRGIMADINGDGAEELFTILEDGSILRLQRDTDSYMTMGVQLRLSTAAASLGPIMVSAGDEDREIYGARVLAPGERLLIGRAEPGPLFVRWRFAGADWQEEMLIVEDGSLPVVITPEGLQQ